MILPTKHLPQERALLTVGSYILRHLEGKKTVSALWENILAEYDNKRTEHSGISYEWFILTLDFLYAIEAIDTHEGLLYRRASS